MEDYSNDSKISHRSKAIKSDKGSLHIQSRSESQLSKEVKDSKTGATNDAAAVASNDEKPAGLLSPMSMLDKLLLGKQQDTVENEKSNKQDLNKTAS